MRLSEFLRTHCNDILAEWDEFASTVTHTGKLLDQAARRDHAGQILLAIAADLEKPQSDAAQEGKSKGEATQDRKAGDSAAESHADGRIVAGFSIDAMITEYRALRASVLRLWSRFRGDAHAEDELQQLTRFNEAIDQAIAESVARYTQQVDKASNIFMGMLGHDLRNPLNTIMLSAHVLVRSGQATEAMTRPIVNSAKRMQGLIELMVDFSRAQSAGNMPLTRKPGNLEEQFRKIVLETGVRHGSERLRLEADGDFVGEWDEGRMGQLLSNLLENGILYGARDKDVVVSMSSTGKDVRFSVINQGRPIPVEEQDRIFEASQRGDTGERRAPGGLGLGLYICREIVRAHEGTIDVTSDSTTGTTFSVVIPRLPVA